MEKDKYTQIIRKYPEYVNQKQLCEICGVCLKTGYTMSKRGDVPYSKDGSFNWFKVEDVIRYLKKQEQRNHPKGSLLERMQDFYSVYLEDEADILVTQDVIRITGFSKSSVIQWVKKGRLQVLTGLYKKFYIPKTCLVDFLINDHSFRTNRRTMRQQRMLLDLEIWLSSAEEVVGHD